MYSRSARDASLLAQSGDGPVGEEGAECHPVVSPLPVPKVSRRPSAEKQAWVDKVAQGKEGGKPPPAPPCPPSPLNKAAGLGPEQLLHLDLYSL